MTITSSMRGAAGSAAAWTCRAGPVLLAVMVAVPIAALLSLDAAVHVWRTGDFSNSDDATRAVQIRDWLAGQGWFDLSAHRMGLPSGVPSHWSRIVDVPVVALIRLSDLVLPPDRAERAARIAFPSALEVGLIAAAAYAARVLAGPRAAVAAGLLVALSGVEAAQFQPGRLHHHAPQIALLVLAVAALLDAMDPARARRAALAGAAIALSLAIGLENLPFVAALLAVLPLAWALEGDRQRKALLALAGGLGLAAPALFAATVPPWRYGTTAVDAFSLMHLAALEAGCALLVVAASLSDLLRTRWRRFAVLAAGAAGIGVAVAVAFPQGLHGPFYGMDPLLHPFWLDDVLEVRPLGRLAREAPGTAAVLVGPMVAGTAAAAVAALRTSGLARARWIVLLALVAVGFAGALWGIRVAFSLQPLALLGGAWAVARAWRAGDRGGPASALAASGAALGLFSSVVWALAPWPGAAPAENGPSCLSAASLRPLAGLGTDTVFAPIDAGPFLLAHTGLSVLAAPYHRDNAGNRAVIEGFLAEPAVARDAVRATGARYLAVCGRQTALEAEAAPDGLAAALARGEVPPWLVPLNVGATPIRVYAVK